MRLVSVKNPILVCLCPKKMSFLPKMKYFMVKKSQDVPFFSLCESAGISSRSRMKNGHRNHYPDVDNTVDLLSPLSLSLSLSLDCFDGERSESGLKDREERDL